MNRLRQLCALCFALLALPALHAQWQNVTYALHGGWNAIYLHGDATHATLDALLANNPEIVSVWRWNPNPNPAPNGGSSLIPATNTPEWSVWVRGQPTQTTLTALTGQSAYLVQASGTASDSYSLMLPQRPLPPKGTWMRAGANLMGFPTRFTSAYPFFSNYFATFPAAIAANTKIYRYVGGDIGPTNPIQVFSPAAERVDRNQAYWFDATVVGNFYAPLEVSLSDLDGLTYGRTGSLVTVRIRNRTAATVTLTVAPVTSAPAPTGQETVVAAVPITRRTFNAIAGAYTETAVTAAFSEPIAPQSTLELTFGIDRTQMSGAYNALFASLLRLTDSGNLLDIYLPVTARMTSLSGLWVGDVALTDVQSRAPGNSGTTTPRSFPLRVLLHVDDNGTARLLSQVYLGRLATAPYPLGLSTRETGLKSDSLATANRFTATHLPLDAVIVSGSGSVALGSTLVRTIAIPFNDPTNPFVHAYHPDHDNKDARGTPLEAGAESYDIARECSFSFSILPPAGSSSIGWGASTIGGTYVEVLTGLRKESITVSGTFELHRVSEIGSITTN